MIRSETSKNKAGSYMAVSEVTFGEAESPRSEKWPFSSLKKKGAYFECKDLTQHTAIRTAASRARKRLKRAFSVRKVTAEVNGVEVQVIRVFRE